jgi:hypothetical protein
MELYRSVAIITLVTFKSRENFFDIKHGSMYVWDTADWPLPNSHISGYRTGMAPDLNTNLDSKRGEKVEGLDSLHCHQIARHICAFVAA